MLDTSAAVRLGIEALADAALAHLCGAVPISASTGGTIVPLQLNGNKNGLTARV
jgi:hypothetical protein